MALYTFTRVKANNNPEPELFSGRLVWAGVVGVAAHAKHAMTVAI